MKKMLSLSLIVLASTSAWANEEIKSNKSGHTISIGAAQLSGDLSDIVDDTVLSIGYDYTFANGVIVGGFYMPELVSESATHAGVTASIDSTVLAIYSGYQFDNNIRLIGGLSFTNTEAELSDNHTSISDDETNNGLMVGIDYVFNQAFVVGARLSTHEVGGVDGNTFGINAGYKF